MKKILMFLMVLSLLITTPVFAKKPETSPSQGKNLSPNSMSSKDKSELTSSVGQDIRALNQERKEQVKTLLSGLKKGSKGNAVSALQKLLAQDPSIYPEGLVTGYLGDKTVKALKNLQKKHALPQVGSVGPKTLEKLKELMDETGLTLESTAAGNSVCVIIPPGHLIAPGFIKKSGGTAPAVPPCQVLPPGIAKKLSTGPGTIDTTAPKITAVSTSEVGATGVKVTWTTDENSNSKVYFGTSTPVDVNTASVATVGDMVKSHSVTLSGLTPSTVYYFLVSSTDATLNVAKSSQSSFTTIAGSADTTNPVISAISTSDITSTSTKVKWTTDEIANSKVYYGTVNPADTSTASTVTKTDFEVSHELSITGLTANTTYYYVVESKDPAGNDATGVQGSFTTLVADIIAPIISTITSSEITQTGAKITWTTDENSNSKVFYSTTNPVDLATALNASSAVMITNHSITLSGLTANTLYYYIVQSVDASTNGTNGAQASFTTLP